MSGDDRFWSKVDKSSGCWLWTAGLMGGGYGQYWDGYPRYAHRWAYEKLVGPIPAGAPWPVIEPAILRIVERAVRTHALPCAATREWAEQWLSGEDRTSRSAVVAERAAERAGAAERAEARAAAAAGAGAEAQTAAERAVAAAAAEWAAAGAWAAVEAEVAAAAAAAWAEEAALQLAAGEDALAAVPPANPDLSGEAGMSWIG